MNTENDQDTRWHLDKKVPISIIVALFMNSLGGVWFMSRLESRVAYLETGHTAQERVDERQDQRAGEAVNLVRGDIQELRRLVERLVERNSKP